MIRSDGRNYNVLRPITVQRGAMKYPQGSCLIECGLTRVLCSASIEEIVPPFLKGTQTGWLTAEYGMLPCSTQTRIPREKNSGRTQEIQRLIGRALRSICDVKSIGERTIRIDCDVLQADGGTRTASISGGFIALVEALALLKKQGVIKKIPVSAYLGAISVGIVKNTLLLDLNYEEDSRAETDMNIVMNSKDEFVEIQGTAEHGSFSKNVFDKMLDLAREGIHQVLEIQKKAVGEILS